jgi:hypothetical protein
MSYYKIIKGVKYDKQLWELATEFTTGEGDGRISEREMQLIAKLAEDGRGITAIEKATLHYIRRHFNLTEKAARWFDATFPPEPTADLHNLIRTILTEEFHLPALQLTVTERDIVLQNSHSNTQVQFESVLRASLTSFLKDGTDLESPRSLVEHIHELYRNRFASEQEWDAALTAKVQEYLKNNATLELYPYALYDTDAPTFLTAEHGESTKDNWIFQLALRDLSDHLFWAITDRTGEKPTYNYGFN